MRIRIDTEQVRESGRRFTAEGDRLAEIGRELQNAIASLNTGAWDGVSRARAEPMLGRVRPESERVAQELEMLGRKLVQVAEVFEQEDNTAARNLERVSWVDFDSGSGGVRIPLPFLLPLPIIGGIIAPVVAWEITRSEAWKKWWADFQERFRNWLDGKGWKTDAELEAEQKQSELQRQKQIEQIGEYLKSIPELNPENWKKLSLEERTELLRKIERKMAEIQGREPADLLVSDKVLDGKDKGDPMGNTNGYYSHANGRIVLNSSLVGSDNVHKVVSTLAHEGRHAYQHAAIDNSGTEPDAIKAEEWKDNFDDYKTVEKDGYEAYYKQPVEVDAREYGSDVASQLS